MPQWGVVVEAVAAFFTALAAVATWRMALSTKGLATATQSSVKTADKAFEREKDALLPVLQLTWSLDEETTARDNVPFHLTVNNVGVGPAFIREITVRNEVNRPAVYQSALRRAIVPPGEFRDGEVERDPGYVIAGSRLSSVSVWYQDVYERWYRSRLLFRYEQSAQGAAKKVVRLFEEFSRLSDPPPYAWDTGRDPRPANYVGLAEAGRCIPWNPSQVGQEWHTLEALAIARSIELLGQAVCGGRALAIKDMGFWLDTAWPQFTIEVNDHFPLALVVRSIGSNTPSPKDITVLATGQFPSDWFASLPAHLPPGLPDLDWSQFGLLLGPKAQDQLWDLYQTIRLAVEERIATPLQVGST